MVSKYRNGIVFRFAINSYGEKSSHWSQREHMLLLRTRLKALKFCDFTNVFLANRKIKCTVDAGKKPVGWKMIIIIRD